MPRNNGKNGSSGYSLGFRESPALTVMDSPAFRVRLGAGSSERTPTPQRFVGRIKALVRQHAAGSGRSGARHSSQFGRGGSAAAGARVRAHPQRVVIKSRVVRHSTYSGPAGVAGALKKHVDYLGRAGVSEEGEPGVHFNSATDLSPEDTLEFRSAMGEDRHHFRFIVSPEAGAKLDLKDYARELVTTMERDLGTRLEWLGVAHYDTDNPHLHLLVRGKDDNGADLVINRNYMSHGMRLQAMELATQHLGPRLAEDVERSLVRDLTADRVTGIDWQLRAAASSRGDGLVSALQGRDGSLAGERHRLHLLTRLQHLESLGLAQEVSPGIWQPDVDLVPKLQALGNRGDIIKLLHERLRGTAAVASTAILSPQTPLRGPVTGRVYGRGTVDELSDRQYLLLDGADGRAYYVPLTPTSEMPGQEARVGAIVTIGPRAPKEHPVDRTMARLAAEQGGIYDPERHAESLRENNRLPPGASAAEYVAAHVKRATWLSQKGLAQALDGGRFRIPDDLPRRAAAELAPGRESGGAITVERHSASGLDTQIRVNGVTWLDRELARGAPVDGRTRMGAREFERDLAGALKDRAEQLKGWRLADSVDGELRIRSRFLDQLYERELQDAGRRLQVRYGEMTRLEEGRRIKGRVVDLEELPSGPHVVIAARSQFVLVPAKGGIARSLHQDIAVSVGRPRSFNPTQPMTIQLAVRYRELTLGRGIRR